MSNESKIKSLIRDYLLDEGILREKLKDPKIEFGFQFIFPPSSASKIMFVIKPLNKEFIIISIGTQISELHIQALNTLDINKKMEFFIELKKFFLLKDVYFRISIDNYRYEISDQVFLKRNKTISKNQFYKSIRKVFTSEAYSNIILEEYCSGKIKPEDINKTQEFSSGSEFSLYS